MRATVSPVARGRAFGMANQYQGYRHIHEEIRAQPHRLVLPVKQAEVEDCKGEGHDGLFIFFGAAVLSAHLLAA